MPNRILSSRLHVSNSVNKLSPLEEVVFIHLILSCDDYGRFYGDAEILKGMMFPKRELTVKQIEAALKKLEDETMISRYTVDGMKYLLLLNWQKYQKPRAKESKFPSPEEDDGNDASECDEMQEPDSRCDQIPPEEVAIEIILNDGTYHQVLKSEVTKYMELYPNVDVMQELRKMAGWSDSNKAKRKTKKGIKAFITNWLGRAQDSGRTKPPPVAVIEPAAGENPFKRFVGD